MDEMDEMIEADIVAVIESEVNEARTIRLPCTRCGKQKYKDEFPAAVRNTRRSGRSSHCHACNAEVRRNKDVPPDPDLVAIECLQCRECKPVCDYTVTRKTKTGYYPYCKACVRLKSADWYNRNGRTELNRAKQRSHKLKARYGLTIREFNSMMESQGGLCGIDGCTKKAVAVDHCHDSGKVRGLLCRECNLALGAMDDDIRRIQGLISYLSEFFGSTVHVTS